MLNYLVVGFLLFVSSHLFASEIDGKWKLQSGSIDYHVHFILKNIEGRSIKIKGAGECKDSECEFLLATPVKSFDSGDSSRDLHMQEVTKAALHPILTVRVKTIGKVIDGKAQCRVQINFAGHEKVIEKFPVSSTLDATGLKAKGQLSFLLSEFSVDRPSLLGAEIDDEIKVDFSVVMVR